MNIQRLPSISLFATAILLAAVTSLHAQSAPANDDFANRQVIPSETHVSVSGTTIGATQEAFEKVNGAGSAAGNSINETKTVWYQWKPPVSGTVQADFTGYTSVGETYLLVFKGTATPTLNQLVAQGYLPSHNGTYPVISFQVTGGQEYTLSLGNTDYPGSFTLQLGLVSDEPSVKITTPKAVAIPSTGQKGEFLFTLSAPAGSPLTLNYKVAGTAIAGVDYKRLRGAVNVPAGATTAQVKIKPLLKGSADDSQLTKVRLTLKPGLDYTIGTPATAVVKIRERE